jgi:hypothetical protein
MGITIFYHGTLRDLGQLPQLQAELQMACARLDWPCLLVDERILGTAERYNLVPIECDDGIPTDQIEIYEVPVDDHLRGAVIQPPGCETLLLTFSRTGQSVWYGNVPGGGARPGHYGLIQEHQWVKTQFSSPEIHVQVCGLLRLAGKYAAAWDVNDEGGYWEAGDERALRATWAHYGAIFDALSDPAKMRTLLQDAGIDLEVTEPPEVGKVTENASPPWREEWGISAEEN